MMVAVAGVLPVTLATAAAGAAPAADGAVAVVVRVASTRARAVARHAGGCMLVRVLFPVHIAGCTLPLLSACYSKILSKQAKRCRSGVT